MHGSVFMLMFRIRLALVQSYAWQCFYANVPHSLGTRTIFSTENQVALGEVRSTFRKSSF